MLLLILEIIGTISFAISGAVVAIKSKFDIFGVAFVGVITAMGGGIVRDILIGRYPPAVFSNFYIFLIAVIASILTFIIVYKNKSHFTIFEGILEYVNNFFDAVGLAAFSVMGDESVKKNMKKVQDLIKKAPGNKGGAENHSGKPLP